MSFLEVVFSLAISLYIYTRLYVLTTAHHRFIEIVSEVPQISETNPILPSHICWRLQTLA